MHRVQCDPENDWLSRSSVHLHFQGGILSGDAAEETKDVLLLDVASLSLGIEVRHELP